MYNIFNSLVKQPLNTEVTVSAAYAGSLASFSIVSSDSATVKAYLNGVLTTPPFNIVAGDKVDLAFTTSIKYSSASYVVYAIAGIKGAVGASTVDSAASTLKEGYKGLSYFDTILDNGIKYSHDFSGNQFIKYNLSANTISPVPLSSAPTGKTSANSTYITEPFGSNIYKVDISTLEVLKKINIGGNPTGGANSVSVVDGKSCIWVVQTDLNAIVCIDANDNIIFTLTGLHHPLTVDASADGKTIAVANNSDVNPSVTIFTYTGSDWSSKQVTLANKPYYTYVDGNGGVWCSTQNSTDLYFIDPTTYAITTLTVGKGQRALKSYDDKTLYVTCAEAGTLVSINVLSKSILQTWSIPEYPIDFAIIGTDIYVASGATSVYKVTAAGAVVKYMSVPSTIYAIDCDSSGNLYSVSLFADQPTFIGVPDVTTTQFYFDTPSSVNIGAAYSTDEFIITDITGSLPISVPNILNAKIFINGVQQAGTTATISAGQKFKLAFDITGVEGESIVFPFFLGNNSYLFNSTAKSVDVVVTPFYFNDITGAALTTAYTSNTVTLNFKPSTASLTLNITGATIVKNGVDQVSSSITFANGDTLALRLTSSTNYQAPSYVKVTAGTYENVWSVTTLNDPNAFWVKPTEKDKLLFENANTSTSVTARLSKITSTGTITSINLEGTPTAVADSLGDYVFIANFFKDKIYKVDANELQVNAVLAMPAGSRPASIAEAITGSDNWDSIAITLSATNTVRFIKKDGSSYYDLTVGTTPMGICSGGDYLWVANKGSSSISVLTFNYTTNKYESYSLISIPSSSPYEIFSNLSGTAIFVTDYIQNKVYVVTTSALSKTYSVGNNPYGVAYSGNYIYCANSYDGTVTKIDTTNDTLTTYNINASPDSITVDKNGYVYVTNMENSKVYVYTSAFVLYATYDTGYTNTWVNASTYETAAFTFVAHLYDDVIKGRLQLETDASSGQFTEQLMLPRDTMVTSDTVTISGLIRSDTVTIEGYKDAALIVNGVTLATGASATINNGDTVAVTLRTPHQYDTSIYLAITAKAYRREFHIKTEPKLFPDDMVFLPEYGIVVGEDVTSNILTVAGITEGYSASVTCDTEGAVLYVNGIPSFTYPVSVNNGDTLQIAWQSSMGFSEIKSINLIANSVSFGLYKIFAISLNGPERDKVYVNWTTLPGLQLADYTDTSSSYVEQNRAALVTNVDDASQTFTQNFLNVEASYTSAEILKLDTLVSKENVISLAYAQPDVNKANILIPNMQANTSPYACKANISLALSQKSADVVLANIQYSSATPIYDYDFKHTRYIKTNAGFADTSSIMNVVDAVQYTALIANPIAGNAIEYQAKLGGTIEGDLIEYQAFNTQPVEVPFELPTPEANVLNIYMAQPAVYFERPDNFEYTYKDSEYVPVAYEYNESNTFQMAYADTTCTYTFNGTQPYVFNSDPTLSNVCKYEELKLSVALNAVMYGDVSPHGVDISVVPHYLTLSTSFIPNIVPVYITHGSISDLDDHSVIPNYIINTGYSDYFAVPQYITAASYDVYQLKPVYEALQQSATMPSIEQLFIKLTQDIVLSSVVNYTAAGSLIPQYVIPQYLTGEVGVTIYAENNYKVNLQTDNYRYFNLTFKQREVPIDIDTNVYSAAEKGSYDETTINDILSTDSTFEEYKLSDGTLIYHYANVNEYGECVNDRYVVTYGLVRGG